jgi:hypothetical protein
VKEEALSNRYFLQTVVSLLGEFRASGARRVVINFSGELDRQLADGFVLNEDPARSEFYKAPRVGKRAIPGSAYRYSKPFPTTELHPGALALEA